MATALAIAQQVARRMGIAVPASLTSADTDGVQMLALLNEIGEELATRFRWQQLTKEAAITSVNAESQGTLAALFGEGLESIVSLTIWDSTDQKFIDGPLTDPTYLQARTTVTGPSYEYKIFDNTLRIIPTIPAGHALKVFYRTKRWAVDVGGTVFKDQMTADDDSALFPDELMRLGLRWKWREEKGLPYAELQRSFEAMAADATARNATGRALTMADSSRRLIPGIFIKAGNTIP